jgi:K+-transporting ATPase KdpF subunit
MHAQQVAVLNVPPGMNLSTGYLVGAVLALLILGYLFYSLARPEKF